MTYDLTIGALHRETGISIPTLKLYADSKLIPSIRDSTGRRLFPSSAAQMALKLREERMARRCA